VKTGTVAAAALAATVLAATACHERRGEIAAGDATGSIGSYRGVADGEDGKARRFRLLLWAELPDRLHAEFLGPFGGPELILDGGGGRLAITLVRDGTSYVGPASSKAIEAVTGVPVPLDVLVRWILTGPGDVPAGIEVTRDPANAPGLPLMLEIREGERKVRIERRRLEGVAALAGGTGTGAPPPGVQEKPLYELPAGFRAGGQHDPAAVP